MQIEGSDDWHVWSDYRAHNRKDLAIRVLVFSRDHGAMIGNVDSIQRHFSFQATLYFIERGLKETMIQWPACFDQSDEDGNRNPIHF